MSKEANATQWPIGRIFTCDCGAEVDQRAGVLTKADRWESQADANARRSSC